MKKRADGRLVKMMTYERPDGTKYKKWFYDTTENKVMLQIQAYELKLAEGRTFKEVAEDWKEEHFKEIESNTERGYNSPYKKAVTYFGKMSIRKITPAMVKAYAMWLSKKGYASKTVTHNLSVAKMIFTKAYIDGEIPSNPSEYIKTPNGLKKTKRKPPMPEEIETIKNSLDKPFGLFAFFILYTGLRKSEALALQYKDIDRENRKIHITKAWYDFHNQGKIKDTTKTEAGNRIVPLLEPLAAILPDGEPDEYIFGLPTGKAYEMRWNAYRKATGIKCTAHQIRHEFVTMLYDAGINEFDAMHIVGHADISTMRNIYTHIRESRCSEITDILNEKLVQKSQETEKHDNKAI